MPDLSRDRLNDLRDQAKDALEDAPLDPEYVYGFMDALQYLAYGPFTADDVAATNSRLADLLQAMSD